METIRGYKGFDKDFRCIGFQFEPGKEYTTKKAVICEEGFHFCEYPLDVFGYYGPGESRYAEVEGSGKTDRHSGDSKVACTKIKIGGEISISALVQASVKFILEKIDWKNAKESNTGHMSAATNTGDRSAATNTGHRSAATNTGHRSAATNTGDRSAATNTGHWSAATNTGDRSAATNTGHMSAATNTGHMSAATNTGHMSAATNTGDWSAATNTGHMSAATNTGHRSAATNTGDWSAATNTGNMSAATVEGKESIAMASGIDGRASGALGCWIVLSEWEENDGEWHIKSVKTAKVDGKKIKANTFYRLKNGKFVEWKES